jgi:mannose-6-phosphate isomerase-like protein (cupin superfamily)
MEKVNLGEKFLLFHDYWNPKIVGEVNDCYIKVAKLKGQFIWHRHDNEDELFLVIKGSLLIRLRDTEIQLGPGEFLVVPRGVEHLPVANGETEVVLIEPRTTLNTGNVNSDRTVAALGRI